MSKKLLSGLMSIVMLAGSGAAVRAETGSVFSKNTVINFVKSNKKIIGGVILGVAAAGGVSYVVYNHNKIVIDFWKIPRLKSDIDKLDGNESIMIPNAKIRDIDKVIEELKSINKFEGNEEFVKALEKLKNKKDSDKIIGCLSLAKDKDGRVKLYYNDKKGSDIIELGNDDESDTGTSVTESYSTDDKDKKEVEITSEVESQEFSEIQETPKEEEKKSVEDSQPSVETVKVEQKTEIKKNVKYNKQLKSLGDGFALFRF